MPQNNAIPVTSATFNLSRLFCCRFLRSLKIRYRSIFLNLITGVSLTETSGAGAICSRQARYHSLSFSSFRIMHHN
ncbi:hypothetical protein vseg_001533 [Gypsophila vaccaria]